MSELETPFSHPDSLTPEGLVDNPPPSVEDLIKELKKRGQNVDNLLELLKKKNEQKLNTPGYISRKDIAEKLTEIYGENVEDIKDWDNQLLLLAQGNILWEIDFSIQALEYKQEHEQEKTSPFKEEFVNNYTKALNQRITSGKEKLSQEERDVKIEEFKRKLLKKDIIKKEKKEERKIERTSFFEKIPAVNKVLAYYNSIDRHRGDEDKNDILKLKKLRQEIVEIKLDLKGNESNDKTTVLIAEIALEVVGVSSDESEYAILKGLEDQFPWWRDLVSDLPDDFPEISVLIKDWGGYKKEVLEKEVQKVVGKKDLKKAYRYIKKRYKKKDRLLKKIPVVGYGKKRRDILDSLNLAEASQHEVIFEYVKLGKKNKIRVPRQLKEVFKKIDYIQEGKADQLKVEKRRKIASYIRFLSVILQHPLLAAASQDSFSNIGEGVIAEQLEKALRSDVGEAAVDILEDIAFLILERASDELLDNPDALVEIGRLFSEEVSLMQFIQGSTLDSHETSEILEENYSPEIILQLEELAKIENPNYMDGKTMFSNAIALAQAEGVEVFWNPPEEKIELNDLVADFLFRDETEDASSYFTKIIDKDGLGNDDLRKLRNSAYDYFYEASEGMAEVYEIIYNQEISSETSMLAMSNYLEFSLNEFSKTGEPLSPDLLLSHALVVNDGDMHRALWDLSNFNKFLTRSILNNDGHDNYNDGDSGFLYSQIFDDYVASSGLTASELFNMMPANRSNTERSELAKSFDPANIVGSNYHIYNILAFLSYVPDSALPAGVFIDESDHLSEHGTNKVSDQAGWLLEGASDIGGILDDLPSELDTQIEVDQFLIIPISEVDENMDFSQGVFNITTKDGKEYFAVLKGSNFRPYLLLSSSKEDLNNSVSVLEINEGLKNGENIEIESAVKVEESSMGPLLSSDIEHLDLESILTLHLYAKVPFDLKNFPISFEDMKEIDSVLLIKMAGVDGLKDEVYRSIIDTLADRNDILSEYGDTVHPEIAILLYYYNAEGYPEISEDEILGLIEDSFYYDTNYVKEVLSPSLVLKFLEESNRFDLLAFYPELIISQNYSLTEAQVTEIVEAHPYDFLSSYLGENGWENVTGVEFSRVVEILKDNDQFRLLSDYPELIISQNYSLTEAQVTEMVETEPRYFLSSYLGENGWENVTGIEFSRVVEILASNGRLELLSFYPELIISQNYSLTEAQVTEIVEAHPYDFLYDYLGENGWENVTGIEFSRVVEILENNGHLGLLSDYPELIISQNYSLTEAQVTEMVEAEPRYFLSFYLGENGWENVPGVEFDKVVEILENSDQLGLLSDYPELIISQNYSLTEAQVAEMVETESWYFLYDYLGENGWENVPGVEFDKVVEILENSDQLELLSYYPELIQLANLTPEQSKKMNEGN